MKTGTYPLTRIPPFPRARRADAATESTEQTSSRDDERSAGNIQAWRSYLPEDCIGTMIKMGWDRTV
jgi:hypothetical protein